MPIQVRMRLQNEYGKFRGSDLQLPAILGARLLNPDPNLQIRCSRPSIESTDNESLDTRPCIGADGRGSINVWLECTAAAAAAETVTVDIEIFVVASNRVVDTTHVLPVLLPTIALAFGDGAEQLPGPAGEEGSGADGTRAGARRAIAAGGSDHPRLQLLVSELPGANVGFRIWDCACETCAYLWAREVAEPGWARGLVWAAAAAPAQVPPLHASARATRSGCAGRRGGGRGATEQRLFCVFVPSAVVSFCPLWLQRVLELGTGTGMVGLCLWSLGAAVTMTDKQSILTLAESGRNRPRFPTAAHGISTIESSEVRARFHCRSTTSARRWPPAGHAAPRPLQSWCGRRQLSTCGAPAQRSCSQPAGRSTWSAPATLRTTTA